MYSSASSPPPALEFCLVMASPHSTGKHIERDFEIAPAIVLRGREPPAANIDLQCRQNELRHRQGPVALLAEIDEPILRLVSDVRVRAFLFGYSTFPARMAAARLVIVPGEHARLIWQCKDDLDALPELLGVTARKIRAGRTALRHEQRVMHESSITDQIGDRGERMAWREHDLRSERADLETLAIREQVVPERPLARYRRPVVDRGPKLLHIAQVIANRHRRPGLPLEVRRRREMVGMDVCVENPLDGKLLLGDISQNGISAPRRRPTRPLIEIEYRVDDRAFRRGGIGDDILDAGRPGIEEALTVGRCFPRRAIHCSATVRSKPNLSPNGRMSSGFIRLSSTSPIA